MNEEYIQEQTSNAAKMGFKSREAEQAVIVQLLGDDAKARRHASELSGNDFSDPQLSAIFQAIQATVADKTVSGVDFITVGATIDKMFASQSMALTARMMSIVSDFSTLNYWSIDDHIQIVLELSARRRTIEALQKALRRLSDPAEHIGAILDNVRAETALISQGKHKWETMSDVMVKTMADLQRRMSGEEKVITTGVSSVDKLIGGFFPGELTVIGARPSVGKSAFGANIALAAAKQGFKVGVVSREMTDVQYGQRVLSNISGVDGMMLRKASPEMRDESVLEILSDAMGAAARLPINFMFTTGTVEELRSEVQRKVEANELDILVVDYLQLLRTQQKTEKENLRIGYISKALKDMALENNIAIIALAQVNRATDGQMPTLSSLKASGDIEQDADGVIFLHRPNNAEDPFVRPEDKAAFSSFADKGLTYLAIMVAKQRQGEIGGATVLFDAAHMRYMVIDHDHE